MAAGLCLCQKHKDTSLIVLRADYATLIFVNVDKIVGNGNEQWPNENGLTYLFLLSSPDGMHHVVLDLT